jgi:hypothetical protein
VQPPRNPFTLLIIGTAIGAVLGAVIGIAIGQSAASAGARVTSVRTVVSTRTIRVAGFGGASTTASTQTTPTDTTTTDTTTATTPSFTSTTDTTATTPSFTTPTDTTTTDTGTSAVAPNDVPPTDPYNPPADFCKTHVCAPSFSKGFGFVVQCADGVWSMQGGQKTVCRNDGGLP